MARWRKLQEKQRVEQGDGDEATSAPGGLSSADCEIPGALRLDTLMSK